MVDENSEIDRYFGFAEEASRGVAESTPEMWCDPMSISPGIPKETEMSYEGGGGRGKTNHRPAFYSTAPTGEMGYDLKILARMLYFALGKRVVDITEGDADPAGEPDTSTEYIYAANNLLLPSFTGWVGSDVKEFRIPGIVLNKLEISAENKFQTMKWDGAGMGETPLDRRAANLRPFNADYPLAFYEIDAHMRAIGSVTPWGSETLISNDIKKLSQSIDNSVKAEDGQRIGTRFPLNIPCGERKTEISFDYDFLNHKWYDLMQGGTDTGPQEGQGSTEFEMMFAIDAGNYGSAQIWYPRVVVSGGPIEHKGRDPTTEPITITPYMKTITIPSVTPVTVSTDCLATFIHKFADSTAAFDGPEEFEDATP